MLGYFINKNGECIDHPINRRTIGLTPFELKDMKNVILTAGGQHKVPILAAALKMGVVDILISDQNTAERLLAYDS